MNLLVQTRAVKIDQSLGLPESVIPELALVKKSYTGVPSLSPLPHPLVIFLFLLTSLCAVAKI